MARYLVTGGCGFIGGHLVDHLLQQGHTVRVLDNLSTGRHRAASKDIELVVGDVAEPSSVKSAMEGIDGCFHLAAVASVEKCTRDWLGSHRTNLGGTIAVFDAAAAHGVRVVYASSAAVYGNISQLPISEDSPTVPLSAYGADKLACELQARVAGHVHNVSTVGLRLFNVYGPRQDPGSPYSGVISLFCRRVSARQPITIHGDGLQLRDFVHVSDVVRAFDAAMGFANTESRVFCVCTGRSSTILDLSMLLGELQGVPVTPEFAPSRMGDIRASVGDPKRAREALKFTAAVELKSGLRDTLSWVESASAAVRAT